MAPNPTLLTFLTTELLFLTSGILLLTLTLHFRSLTHLPLTSLPTTSLPSTLLLTTLPLTPTLILSALILLTSTLSLPSLLLPSSRSWLRLHGWSVLVCALFTLGLAVAVWIPSLSTRADLGVLWARQTARTQSLLQQRFDCCGYTDATTAFVQDTTCPSALAAATKGGCVAAFASYANAFLALLFTGLFGLVALDVGLLLAVAMLLRHRREMERYRFIDEKNEGGRL